MRLQVFLAMGQDRISKEEDRELLYQRVYVVTTTQELCHITINYVWLAGGVPRYRRAAQTSDVNMAFPY